MCDKSDFLKSLLKKASRGDDDAFREFVEKTKDKLFGAIYMMLKNEGLTEEIMQESYLMLWKKNRKLDIEKPLNYLYRIALNRAIDYLRKEEPFFHDEKELDEINFVSAESPDFLIEKEEERMKVNNVLSRLTERERTVLLMSDYLEMNSFEIAHILNVSPSTIRNQLLKAREKFRKFMME